MNKLQACLHWAKVAAQNVEEQLQYKGDLDSETLAFIEKELTDAHEYIAIMLSEVRQLKER